MDLSGGSLALAFGISGVATYGLAHAHGAATFTRDRVAATRSYAATTTPGEALLDAGEFALAFAPGNFAGAAAGRGARIIGEELTRDPTAFWALRRTAMRGDAGPVEIGLFTGSKSEADTWVASRVNVIEELEVAADGASAGANANVLRSYATQELAVPTVGDGPVVFAARADLTPEELRQLTAYIDGSNAARLEGALSPTGRVSTSWAILGA